MTDLKSLSVSWRVFWAMWALLPLAYVAARTAPTMTGDAFVPFDTETMLAYGLAWLTAGLAALIYVKRGLARDSWLALWVVWSAFTLAVCVVSVLPKLLPVLALIREHPALLSDYRALPVLVSLFGWLLLGVLVLVLWSVKADFWRTPSRDAKR